LTPVTPTEREPILDALRGFAILGILLVNIEVMRGSDWLVLTGGGAVASADRADQIVQFAIGWLATAKFISSLAILFGVGAALIFTRALERGQAPHPLLARRYAWLMAFGIAHMLLYPGDILFIYGLTGFILLAFITSQTRTVLWWSITIFIGFNAMALLYLATFPPQGASGDGSAPLVDESIQELITETVAAYGARSAGGIASVHVSHALVLQAGQLWVLPWILALFLFGFAVGRTGLLKDFANARLLLQRGALIGLALGVPANIGLGYGGPLSGYGAPSEPMWLTLWAAAAQLVGAPLLAVGYLCALSLYFLRRRVFAPLAAVGRMALTAYILESALTLSFFGGLALYDRLSTTSALLVVVTVWTVLLVFCPLWLRQFQLGPVEWLWRSLTYGRAQRILATP
jgi:uncharacterized protein